MDQSSQSLLGGKNLTQALKENNIIIINIMIQKDHQGWEDRLGHQSAMKRKLDLYYCIWFYIIYDVIMKNKKYT